MTTGVTPGNTPSAAQAPRRSRAAIWFMVALFFGPLLVSYVWYFGFDARGLAPTTQHGELILPPRQLPDVALTGVAGHSGSGELFRGRWSVVYFAPGECASPCAETLYDLRQMRLRLGNDIARVQRIWLYTGAAPDEQWLRSEHPDLIAIAIDGQDLAALLAEFPTDGVALDASDQVFFVDPVGQLMMRYSSDISLADIYEDLEHLLGVSGIG